MYKPPFNITNAMLVRSRNISEKITKISNYQNLKKMPILRRNSNIKSIHSSLAIEANSLSIKEFKDLTDAKLVIGPINEILEVKNAYKVYSKLDEFDAYSEKDLIKAHDILVEGLTTNKGYRNHAEGVFDGDKVIFVAPSHKLVPSLMRDLFSWLKLDKDTPLLIKSCIFHYEFVFIHPFSDGNGRTARFYQNVILNKWNSIFSYLPIESKIKEYQEEYYKVIDKCNKEGNSNAFIELMLRLIENTIDETLVILEKEKNTISNEINKLLEVMEYDTSYSAIHLMKLLKIKSRDTLRNTYLNPAIKNDLIKMTLPNSPKSKNQRYIKK